MQLVIDRQEATLSRQVVHALRSAILDGQLEPGRHLTERELCTILGVSRSLVREAVQRLVAEGLIMAVPHRGLMVARLDLAQIQAVYSVRAVLEGLACAEFTRNADAARRERLASIADAISVLEGDGAAARLLSLKDEFYTCLLEGAANPVLSQLFIQLNNRVRYLRRLSLSHPGRLPETRAEIAAMVDAMLAGDAAGARKLAEAHVAAAAAMAKARFAALER